MWRWGERRPSAHVSESASVQCTCSLTSSLICFESQMLLPWATGKWYFSRGNLWPHLIASCCQSHHIRTVIPKPKLLSLTKVLWHLAGLFSWMLKDDFMFCGSEWSSHDHQMWHLLQVCVLSDHVVAPYGRARLRFLPFWWRKSLRCVRVKGWGCSYMF